MKFKHGRVVLVVGATKGVGQASYQYLKKQGYTVYGTSRSGSFEDGEYIPLDVREEQTIKDAINHIINKERRLDILINCPGYGLAGAIEDTQVKEAKSIFDVNFFGIMNVCKQVLPIMRQQKQGLIINISSVAGFISLPYQSMYCASKYALESYTESLRMEMKPFGVKASLIEPGVMKTNFERQYVADYQNSAHLTRCEKAVNAMIKSEQNGPEATVVVKELRKILNKKQPPIRTVVGFSYKMIYLLKKILPARLVEFIVTKTY